MSARPGRLRIAVVYGTRPEIIKMAPVVAALRARPDRFAVRVWTTAQHRELLDQAAALFALHADVDLDLMRPRQELSALMARALVALDTTLTTERPDWLLVQGDTTTALAAAFAAFHRGVRVGHVEAGLRSGDLQNPFPEEANRRAIDAISDVLFAPTARAEAALLAEGHAGARVFRVGNTVVDALRSIEGPPTEPSDHAEVLVTLHRRESFGPPMAGLFAAVATLASRFPALRWILPLHPNPAVARPARQALRGLPNVDLVPAMPYDELVHCLARARLVLTDSGGIQEEAPDFGKVVLVLRKTTERSEGVALGIARLVGTEPDRVVREASRLLRNHAERRRLSKRAQLANPYGDGRAAERIAAILAGEAWQPFSPSQVGAEVQA